MRGPASMLLGKDRSTTITLRDTKKPVRLQASVGTISEPQLANGSRTATYTPPSTRFPQVAIIVASTEDLDTVEFITIPLLGQPTIRVESEPRAVVHVGVDGKKFGPLKLNRRGQGKIRLVVPPGVETATVHSADHLGNEKKEPHTLGVPPFQQLVTLCPQGSDELVVVAIDRRGNAMTNAALQLEAEMGTLASPVMRAPGIYSARYQVHDDLVPVNSARLTASMPTAGPASTMTCKAQVPRETPSSILVSASNETFVAGSKTRIEVLARFTYTGKRLPRLVLPTVSVDLGTVSAVKPAGENRYRVVWTLPNAFQGKSKATIRVGMIGGGLDSQAQVKLEGGELAKIQLSSDKAQLVADRSATAVVHIQSFDQFGNAIPSEMVRLAAGQGTVGAVEVTADGGRASYRTPLRHDASQDTITARSASGIDASLSVLLDPAPRRIRANARLGYATNLGAVSSLAFAADAGYRIAMGQQGLILGLESGYFSSSETRPRSDEVEDVGMRIAVVPLIARAVYEVNTLPIQVYGGGGAGILFARATIESPRTGMRVERAPNVALSAILGARKRLGRGLIVLEAAYWRSNFDGMGLVGNIGGLRLTGGYGFEL